MCRSGTFCLYVKRLVCLGPVKMGTKRFLPGQVTFVYVFLIEIWLNISVLGKGTVEPISPFDAPADAKKLHDGLTKGDAGLRDVADLVSTRSCEQRLKIKESFEKDFGPLDKFTPQPRWDTDYGYMFLPSIFKCNVTLCAYHIDYTFGDYGAIDAQLIAILVYCSQTAEFHDQLSSEYKAMYNKDLKEALDKCLEDDFHNVVMEMMTRKRAANSPSDEKFIQDTAQALIDEKGGWENHRPKLDETMFQTSIDVLKKVLDKFKELNGGVSLSEAVDGITETYTYQQIYNFIMDPVGFYAEQIDYSLGRFTDEERLLFNVLLTSETYLQEVEQKYNQLYSESLRDELESTTYIKENMDYKTKLYAFLKYPLP